MASCDTLLAGSIGTACPNGRGYESDAVIINYEDVDWSRTMLDDVNSNLLKALVLKTGKRGYPVKQRGANPFTGSTTEMAESDFVHGFNHTVSMIEVDYSPEAVGVINALANGKFVMVLHSTAAKLKTAAKHMEQEVQIIEDPSGEYPVFGLYQGLRASEITRDAYSDDSAGGWLINLVESNSPVSGLFLWAGTAAATGSMYESLKAAAS